MDKANLSSVRKRIEQAKQPYEVYDSLGRLKQEVFPYNAKWSLGNRNNL